MTAPYTAYHYADRGFALPTSHRYPLPRYARLVEALRATGWLAPTQIRPAPRAPDEHLRLAHSAAYLAAVVAGHLSPAAVRRLNLPWSPALVERARHIVGATCQASRLALQDGLAFVLGGGTHHAHAEYGSGYCVFNDLAVAARLMIREERARRVVILDCDVHQGDGTAAILAGETAILTLSVHAAGNFPFEKARSDLDIDLPDGCDDAGYLQAVRRGLAYALRHARADLALYVAGADAHVDDRIGRLAVSRAGLAARDRLVMSGCRRIGLPVVVVMGGGYSHPVEKTVALNLQTIAVALQVARAIPLTRSPAAGM